MLIYIKLLEWEDYDEVLGRVWEELRLWSQLLFVTEHDSKPKPPSFHKCHWLPVLENLSSQTEQQKCI